MNNTLAYLGAIIDGEGCILIGKHKSRGRIQYQPAIIIGAKDESLIKFIHSHFPGSLSIKRKIYHYWSLTGLDKIKNFLEQVLPYLLIKREQALLLLDFVKSREIHYHKGRDDRGYTDQEISLYEKIKKLKKEYPSELPFYHFTDEEKWYYLAGLIDGEGSVRIAKAVHKNSYGNEKLILVPQISIANTDKRLMEFLKKEFVGFYHTKKRQAPKRTIHQWCMQGLKEEFFKSLNNKLILKQEQLSLLLQYIESRKINYTRENELEIFLKMQKLNKKGKENYTYEKLKEYTNLIRSQRKLFIAKEELERLYQQENLSIREIARRFGVHYNAIHTRMLTYGIVRRISNHEKNKIRLNLTQASVLKVQ